MRTLLVWLSLTVSALAQTSHVTVKPESPTYGELVTCDVELPEGSSASWIAIEPVDLRYRIYDGGRSIALSSGVKQQRIMLLLTTIIWAKQEHHQERVIIEIGRGPEPPPIPPDPDPPVPPVPVPPGPRKIVVLAESDDSTPSQAIAINLLRAYALEKGHKWGWYDPQQDSSAAVANYLAIANKAGVELPCIIVIATIDSQEVAKPIVLPPTGTTGAEGTKAGQEAIAKVKELGA